MTPFLCAYIFVIVLSLQISLFSNQKQIFTLKIAQSYLISHPDLQTPWEDKHLGTRLLLCYKIWGNRKLTFLPNLMTHGILSFDT